jgi:membrane-associated phospholipid phosphatase
VDRTVFRWINNLATHTSWANGVARFYANYGIVVFAALCVVAFLDARKHDNQTALAGTIWAAGGAVVALGIAQLIGRAVDRARPYDQLANVHLLVARTSDFSFPSDHATVSGAVAVALLLVNRRWGIVAGVAALAMAFTRVYVGAHFPGDVVGGLALGAAVAVAGRYTVVPVLASAARRLAGTALRPLVTAAR